MEWLAPTLPPRVARSKRAAAASRSPHTGSQGIESAGTGRPGAWRTHRRSRAVPWATTTWCPVSVVISTSGSDPDGSGIARAGSAASRITTSGAASGDQSAGFSRGFACGSEGKAQAPTPGQALLLCELGLRELVDAGQGVGMILPIAGITIQKFLRKIRIVMMSILICGLW